MAENITLNNIATFQNDTSAANTYNNNNTAIVNAFADVLSRSGVGPNQMQSTLDMNNQQIINLPAPTTAGSPARLLDISGGQITVVTATTGTSGHTVPFLDGNNTWSGSNSFNPTSGLGIGFLATQNLTGTTSPGFVANGVNINSDNVNGGSGNSVIGFQVNQIFGGSAATGNRFAITGQVQLNAATNASNGSRAYSGVIGQGIANTGDGGTNPIASGTSQGEIYGVIGQGFVGASATSLLKTSAGTFQTAISTGGSTWSKAIVRLSGLASDNVAGTVINTMLWLGNESNASVKWTNGILIDNLGGIGSFPISAGGTIFRTGAGSVTTGLDFTQSTFSGNALQTPAFSVSSTGLITSGSAGFSSGTLQLVGITSGNISISSNALSNLLTITQPIQSGVIGTVGGSLTLAGQTSGSATLICSATGGQFVTTNSLTTTGTLASGGVGASSGQLLLVGNTSGSVALATQPISGGLLQFQSAGSFSANGAVATALTSIGPTGSHTTVQTWLTIVDNGGVTRYIPCF